MAENPPAYVEKEPSSQPGYSPQGQPGYPPQGQPGYPPQGQPGYPPQEQPGYPPQGQPGFTPNMPQQNATIITGQPITAIPVVFGDQPVAMTCPFCQAQIATIITFKAGEKTWLWAALFCFLGGLLCVWIPFVVDGFKDCRHSCPNCQRHVGTLKR
ncbi:calcium-binding protein P-like [Hydractinia symbiolongicarpus]|uniref:calcium-binding protein P-like n=1 Tax=Hydractinia symbiolongicarpus TaxID=13093 RepID=UPI00254B0FF4|nr:calcium-binding protein P-like [Hydractinia symbiolongicarpus]